MNHDQQTISNLTLLLMYLTSWKEKDAYGENYKAWKGYDFDILNKLEEQGFISQSRTAKSVYLTEEGLAAAKKLAETIKQSRQE